jgi:hypothetical protein
MDPPQDTRGGGAKIILVDRYPSEGEQLKIFSKFI